MFKNVDAKLLAIEGISLLMTAIVVAVVMYPIWTQFPEYKFSGTNIIYIVAFVTFARYTFLLRYTLITKAQNVKIGFILLTLIIILGLVTQIQDFNVWIDAGDPERLMPFVPQSKRDGLLSYIKSEFLFFAVGAVVASVFLAARLMRSVWRTRNKEGV
jgi:glucan phosphoethanolaminetransferase (alkaline phosphatase superfamily)